MQNIQNEKIDNLNLVKEVYESGNYFKDAFEWYTLKFFGIYVERFLFFILFIFSIIIISISGITLKNLFPIKEQFPVLVKQKKIMFEPRIEKLRPEKLNYNNNESLGRYLAIYYLRELMNHNYINSNMDALNEKLERIKIYSSKEAFEKAKKIVNTKFTELFNKNISQTATIRTFRFVGNNKDSFSKAVKKDKSIYTVEMDYYIITNTADGPINEHQKILLTFKFNEINYNKRLKQFDKIVFTVVDFDIKTLK